MKMMSMAQTMRKTSVVVLQEEEDLTSSATHRAPAPPPREVVRVRLRLTPAPVATAEDAARGGKMPPPPPLSCEQEEACVEQEGRGGPCPLLLRRGATPDDQELQRRRRALAGERAGAVTVAGEAGLLDGARHAERGHRRGPFGHGQAEGGLAVEGGGPRRELAKMPTKAGTSCPEPEPEGPVASHAQPLNPEGLSSPTAVARRGRRARSGGQGYGAGCSGAGGSGRVQRGRSTAAEPLLRAAARRRLGVDAAWRLQQARARLGRLEAWPPSRPVQFYIHYWLLRNLVAITRKSIKRQLLALKVKISSHRSHSNCYIMSLAAVASPHFPPSWAYQIRMAASQGQFLHAISLFLQMRASVAPRSSVPASLPAALKSCAGLGLCTLAASLHALAIRSGSFADRFTANALLNLCIKLPGFHHPFGTNGPSGEGGLESAAYESMRKVFDEMLKRDAVSWNTLILGCAEHKRHQEALSMVREMWRDGFMPDTFTLSTVLPIFAECADIKRGMVVHGYAIKNGFDNDVFVGSSLIDMYANCTQMDYSMKVFDSFSDCDAVLWNSMLAGYAQNGSVEEALGIFRRMLQAGVRPVPVTFSSLIPAFGNLSLLRLGKQLHAYLIRARFNDNIFISSSLIDMYCKCGNVDIARRVFNGIQSPDIVSWTAMIMGYALHGPTTEAFVLFERMELGNVKPNHITFLAVLTACSHAGLVDNGWKYFNSMSNQYGFVPSLEHCAALADTLGRAGDLDEAYNFISEMKIKPTSSVWSTLLRACRVHKNTVLAEEVAKKIFELEPKSMGSHVILSNMYSASGRWNEAAQLRKSMRIKGMKKEPACSWIEVKNKLHVFIAHDKSHPWYDRIIDALNVYSEQMIRQGYVPNMEDVLQDIEEEQKREGQPPLDASAIYNSSLRHFEISDSKFPLHSISLSYDNLAWMLALVEISADLWSIRSALQGTEEIGCLVYFPCVIKLFVLEE
uniref:Uncharacterized protein n=1 Tax=Oryza glaberrima TaxID=4538 RepID=I1QEL6_ORYGL